MMNDFQQGIKIVFLFFCSFFIFPPQQLILNNEIKYSSSLPIHKKLQLHDLLSKYRFSLSSLGIAAVLYCNYSVLIENFKKYPVLYFLMGYFLWNYIVDLTIKNCQLDQTKKIFLLSRAMSRNLLSIFAVRNTMQKLCVEQKKCFNEQNFLNMIVQATGRSIEELESFTLELLKMSIHDMSALQSEMYASDIEEKIYFFCKDCITIKEMIVACKNDEDIYDLLVEFSLDPENYYEQTMYQLCYIFSKKFSYFL